MSQSTANDKQLLERVQAHNRQVRQLLERYEAAKKTKEELLSQKAKQVRELASARDMLCRNDSPEDPMAHCAEIVHMQKKLDKAEEQQAKLKVQQGGIVAKHHAAFIERIKSDQLPLFATADTETLVAKHTIGGAPITLGTVVHAGDETPWNVVAIHEDDLGNETFDLQDADGHSLTVPAATLTLPPDEKPAKKKKATKKKAAAKGKGKGSKKGPKAPKKPRRSTKSQAEESNLVPLHEA